MERTTRVTWRLTVAGEADVAAEEFGIYADDDARRRADETDKIVLAYVRDQMFRKSERFARIDSRRRTRTTRLVQRSHRL